MKLFPKNSKCHYISVYYFAACGIVIGNYFMTTLYSEAEPSLTELACVSLRKVCTNLLLSPHTDATNGKHLS